MCSYRNKAGAAFFFFSRNILQRHLSNQLATFQVCKSCLTYRHSVTEQQERALTPPSPQTGTVIPKKERKTSEFWSQQRQIYIVCLTHNAPLVLLDHSSLPPTLWPNGKPTPVLTYASYTVHTVSTIQLFLSPLHISSCCTTMHVQGSMATP